MKSLNKVLFACLLPLVSFNSLASTYNFDGVLVAYDELGASLGPSTATGYVDFDLNTGLGNDGLIQEFLPKTGGVIFSNIQITGIGGDLFNVDFLAGLFGSDFTGSLVWEITELGGGDLSVVTVDGNGDGIPGLPLSDATPFPGFSMALDGTLSAVPVPAAIWLFGSGLLGLLGVARCRAVKV